MTQDPVCGQSVDEKSATPTSTYERRKYAFCSQECKAKSEHSPEQYPAQAEQPMTQQRNSPGKQQKQNPSSQTHKAAR